MAESPVTKSHLVAVFVDKNIYKDLESDIKWYASQYIQSRISDSKALVLPIDVNNFAANDIVSMLENMYFDGLKGSSSDLLGAVFLGNIPLPVVQQNGFVYPSIYPYVDFENQEFVYDANQNYFVYNDNPNGQAEIWHGLINFGTDVSKYTSYFKKLKTYVKSPSTYVSPRFWYDDIIGMKSTFLKDTLSLYVNNFTFTEDVAYHRYTNTLLNYFKDAVNSDRQNLLNQGAALSSDIASLLEDGGYSSSESAVPTKMLSSVLKELLKTYDNLFPGAFLSQTRDNTQAASRWYKGTGANMVDAVDSHIGKIVLKDSWVLSDVGSGVSPLLVNYNTQLEKALDDAIVSNKWALKVPVLDTYKYAQYSKQSKLLGAKKYCSTDVEDSYQNYYFGKKVSEIKTPDEFSIYRGTFKNLTGFVGQSIYADATRLKSGFNQPLGSSYGILDTQIEANRGYNINSAARESDVYNANKKPLFISATCAKRSKFLWFPLYCKSYTFKVDDESKIEDPNQFAQRNRGGASSLNLDTGLLQQEIPVYKLKNYNYLNAQSPIFDLGGSTLVTGAKLPAYSISAILSYPSLIKVATREGEFNYPLYLKNKEKDATLPILSQAYKDGKGEYKEYKEFIGDKVRNTSGLDFFQEYKNTSNRGSGKSKKIYISSSLLAQWSSGPLGGKCDNRYAQEYNYSYLLFNSIIKNIAPTVDQINGTYQSPFTGDGLFKKHYEYFSSSFTGLYEEFSAVKDSETLISQMISYANGFNAAALTLSGTNNSDTTALFNASESILATTGSLFQSNLDSMDDMISQFYQIPNTTEALSLLANISSYFDYMIQAEALDGRKSQFLKSWLTSLTNQVSLIKTTAATLSSKYSTLNAKYSALSSANYGIATLQAKRAKLNSLQNCGVAGAYAGMYAGVCQSIDKNIATLSGFVQNVIALNQQVDEANNPVKPFADASLTAQFADSSWTSTLTQMLAKIVNWNKPLDKEPAATLVEGLNQSTKDRPIDSDRNTTFKGLGGDIVKFSYPNLYEVNVYDTIDGALVLKNPKAIESAIKAYLQSKAMEYNTLLTAQKNKQQTYYTSNKDAFDKLATVDLLATANPSKRSTVLLSQDHFVNLLKNRIPEIAEMLYYQSLPSYLRTVKTKVLDDLQQVRSSFDINRKISYVMSGYLTKHDDLGPIISPSYVSSGYEVAYINSDGSDYIPISETPDFISSIQKTQLNYTTATSSNQVLAQEANYAQTISSCKLGSDYSALLFDVKKLNSPWIDALKCWWKNIPTSTKFSVSFSVGPSPKEFVNSLKTMYQNWKDSFKKLYQDTTPIFSGDVAEYWNNITQPVQIVDTNTISKIDFVFSSSSPVMAGTQMPFTLLARDKDGKVVTSSVNDYRIGVSTGNGIIVDGINNSNMSIFFNELDEAWIYQAPKVDKRTEVVLSLYDGQDKVIASKQIWVDPALLTISSNGNNLYANKSVLRTLQFSLQDFATYPTIKLDLLTPSGTKLDAAVTVSSKNGLFAPGLAIGSLSTFTPTSSFLIDKGTLSVSLKPTFKAGDDILYIEIPGLEPIEIPVRILAGAASKVNLDINKQSLQVGQSFSGTVQVSDKWDNVVSGAKVSLGSLGSLGLSTKVISVGSQGYTFTSQAKEPGGISYVYATITDSTSKDLYPDYHQITVQKPFLPEKDLNVMYLNLFGSDWGNQWAYGSDHKGYTQDLINNSPKLLAVTTQLVDLNALKKFTFVVGQNAQIHPFVELDFSMHFSGDKLSVQSSDLATINFAKLDDISLSKLSQFADLDPDTIDNPTMFILEDSLDSSLTISSDSLLSGDEELFNLASGYLSSGLSLDMDTDLYKGYNLWHLKSGDKTLSTLLFVLPTDTQLKNIDLSLQDSVQYGSMETFADASTNGLKGLGVYTSESVFQKEGYVSIEDSADYRLGVGFTNDFKNITLFGDGKSVGESTVPYGSPVLINYGDPLLKRITDNIALSDISLDTGIGEQVYSDPSKSIFKTISADINNDAQNDLVIVFTDGTVKILKNYGGTHPYRDVGELFRLVGGISDIQLGDVDNNNYTDLIVRTDQNQLRVYTNNRGVFDVDGKLVCLNTNVEQGQMSTNPSDMSTTQLLFQDMDKDGVLDIVSNDSIGDLKIFYGGISDDGVNYLSTLSYACDADWYKRQKNANKLVKRFGMSVDNSLYIQDNSLLHLKGWDIVDDSDTSLEDEEYDENMSIPSGSPSFFSDLGSSFSADSFLSNMTSFYQETSNQAILDMLEVSPISDFTPSYEDVADHDTIGYKKMIALSGNKEIAVYKQYEDINGGILLSGDQVKINITFIGLANGVKASYIDRLLGPRSVSLNKNDIVSTWKIEEGLYDPAYVSGAYDEDEVQFVMDNIRLSKGDKLVVSYIVSFVGKPSVKLSIDSIAHPKTLAKADKYPDIIVKPDDSCKQYRWAFMNTSSNNHRDYDEIFDTSLQKAVSSYLEQGNNQGSGYLDSVFPKSPSVKSSDSAETTQNAIQGFVSSVLGSVGGLSENWSVSDLFSPGSTNISFNMDALDQAMAPVMEKVDKAANALCQGFKLGKSGCQPPAPFNLIPFNQAFLAPGQYHLFGCTPKLPNPLAPVFTYLNKMLGGGMPVLFFPGTLQTPIGPIPMVGSSFVPIVQKGLGDSFGLPGLPLAGGVYPSQIRLYVAPTLTLQMGVAICFGPYGLASKIPKLLRDLGGNCVVTAFPLYSNSCGVSSDSGSGENVSTEVLDPWMTELASQGSCDNPPQQGNTRISSTSSIIKSTVSSPVYMSSRGENNSSWTKAVPSGNLWSMATISFNDKPTKTTAATNTTPNVVALSDFSFAGFKFTPGGSINLKILGSNAKGIIKKFVQDWLGRQTKYIMNNLTKMTLSITLPNVTDLVKGFGELQADKSNDVSFASSKNISNLTGLNKIAGLASQQNYTAASDLVNNPFESLSNLFQNVPLVHLQTKDIVVNVPMVTTENILKYSNYLKGWLNQQQKILKQWVEAVAEALNICGQISKADAKQELQDLVTVENIVSLASLTEKFTQAKKEKTVVSIQSYKQTLNGIIAGTIVSPKLDFAGDVIKSWDNSKGQLVLLAAKAKVLPALQLTIQLLKDKQTISAPEKALLSRLQTRVQSLNGCVSFSQNLDVFTNFYVNTTSLVKNVQQNIQVLEQYRKFPTQLSKWMGAANTYLSDVTSFLSNTVVVLVKWMNTNAKIYSKYVDALILIIASIKTWQILIDFSVNWNQKCGKCSRDSYGSYNCGLSFLLDKIKLPILPIPPFKIPNIYVDLSHIDLGMTIQLPRFRFVPMNISLPTIPNIPSPPSVNISTSLDVDLSFAASLTKTLNIELPNIPILPSPPELPELPSFIPKVDFALPTLPPAPKIPTLIPEISATLDFASFLGKIFCITKGSVGLVGEKGVKAKVEQLTQRTWDVKSVDFFNKTVTWKKDPPLYGFDFKLDGYLQFKLDFDSFYGFLNQIVSDVNAFTTTSQNKIQKTLSQASAKANEAVRDFSDTNLKDIDFDLNIKTDVNINTDVIKSASTQDAGVEYDVALKQLKKGLAYFDAKVQDDPIISQKLTTVKSAINDAFEISPTSTQVLAIEKQVKSVLAKKQNEIKTLASRVSKYDAFVAQVGRQDSMLVSDDTIDTTYTVPLFTTSDENLARLASQENPYKLSLDTNAGLVERYLNTVKNSDPTDLGVDQTTYNQTSEYLDGLSTKVKQVYDRLDLDPIAYDSCGVPRVVDTVSSQAKEKTLLAANTTNGGSSTTALSDNSAYDLSSYVRGVFVPKSTTSGTQMVNVVKSDAYIDKIGNNYQIFSGDKTEDLNRDGLVDVLMRDAHSVYIKYSQQHSVPKKDLAGQNYDSKYYVYDGGSWYIASYDGLLETYYPDGDGYVPFDNNISVKLVQPHMEVKNFVVNGQGFDEVQFAWQSQSDLGYEADGYLVKLNQRIDTFADKDKLYDLGFDQETLSKTFILFLPEDTDYEDATINLGEKAYSEQGKSFTQKKLVSQLLAGGQYSGAIIAVKYYDPSEKTITSSLSEIPRFWQYAKVASLKNIGGRDSPDYVLGSVWSNQIVVGRQILSDTKGPSSTISLYRPSIKAVVSEGSDHKGYVGTTYTLQASWEDNLSVSKMWIAQDDNIIVQKSGFNKTGFIELTGLYFTGATSIDFVFGAEDSQGNSQVDPVRLSIEVPELSVSDVSLTGNSGQVVAELSHDIDEGLVSFQRERNERWQVITGSLSDRLGGFSVKPLQKVVTGSVFSFGQDVGFYDTLNRQIGSLTPNGNMTILPQYADRYQIVLDLTSTLPSLRVLDKKDLDTLFWVHLPPKKLLSLDFGQQGLLYKKLPLEGSTFGAFDGGTCIQNSSQQCIIYISPLGEIYVPQEFVGSLRGTYFYNPTQKAVVYTLRDALASDTDPYIIQALVQVDILH